jgi:hypothetical protein
VVRAEAPALAPAAREEAPALAPAALAEAPAALAEAPAFARPAAFAEPRAFAPAFAPFADAPFADADFADPDADFARVVFGLAGLTSAAVFWPAPVPPRFALLRPGRERGRLPITPGSSLTRQTILTHP